LLLADKNDVMTQLLLTTFAGAHSFDLKIARPRHS